MGCLLVAVALIAMCGVHAEDNVVFPIRSTWKWDDSGNDITEAGWELPEYDDSRWQEGTAPFGYGLENIALTETEFGSRADNKRTTTFFRTSFYIDPQRAAALATLKVQARVLYAHGVRIYINGVEAWRGNLIDGELVYLKKAASHKLFPATTQYEPSGVIPGSLFQEGINYIAADTRLASRLSAEMVFDMSLAVVEDVPEPSPVPCPPIPEDVEGTVTITKGPYIQMSGPTTTVIRWWTDKWVKGMVRYDTGPALSNVAQSLRCAGPAHEVWLENMDTNQVYFFRLLSTTLTVTNPTDPFTFKTSPRQGESARARFWVVADGDRFVDAEQQLAVRDAALAAFDNEATPATVMFAMNPADNFFSVYGEVLKSTPLWTVPGDTNVDEDDTNALNYGEYLQQFTLPRNGECGGVASNTENYYSLDYGQAHFVVLNSNAADITAMKDWLTADLGLAVTTAKFLIVFMYHAPYSKGLFSSDTDATMTRMRTEFMPILEVHGVDIVVSGNSHSYERSTLINGHYGDTASFDAGSMQFDAGNGNPLNDGQYQKPGGLFPYAGTITVVAGSSAEVDASNTGLDHPAMVKLDGDTAGITDFGSLVIDMDHGTLETFWLDSTGAIRDAFKINKANGNTPSPRPDPTTAPQPEFEALHAQPSVLPVLASPLPPAATLSNTPTISVTPSGTPAASVAASPLPSASPSVSASPLSAVSSTPTASGSPLVGEVTASQPTATAAPSGAAESASPVINPDPSTSPAPSVSPAASVAPSVSPSRTASPTTVVVAGIPVDRALCCTCSHDTCCAAEDALVLASACAAPSTTSSSAPVGAIVGGVVAVLVVAAIIVAAVWLYRRRKAKGRPAGKQSLLPPPRHASGMAQGGELVKPEETVLSVRDRVSLAVSGIMAPPSPAAGHSSSDSSSDSDLDVEKGGGGATKRLSAVERASGDDTNPPAPSSSSSEDEDVGKDGAAAKQATVLVLDDESSSSSSEEEDVEKGGEAEAAAVEVSDSGVEEEAAKEAAKENKADSELEEKPAAVPVVPKPEPTKAKPPPTKPSANSTKTPKATAEADKPRHKHKHKHKHKHDSKSRSPSRKHRKHSKSRKHRRRRSSSSSSSDSSGAEERRRARRERRERRSKRAEEDMEAAVMETMQANSATRESTGRRPRVVPPVAMSMPPPEFPPSTRVVRVRTPHMMPRARSNSPLVHRPGGRMTPTVAPPMAPPVYPPPSPHPYPSQLPMSPAARQRFLPSPQSIGRYATLSPASDGVESVSGAFQPPSVGSTPRGRPLAARAFGGGLPRSPQVPPMYSGSDSVFGGDMSPLGLGPALTNLEQMSEEDPACSPVSASTMGDASRQSPPAVVAVSPSVTSPKVKAPVPSSSPSLSPARSRSKPTLAVDVGKAEAMASASDSEEEVGGEEGEEKEEEGSDASSAEDGGSSDEEEKDAEAGLARTGVSPWGGASQAEAATEALVVPTKRKTTKAVKTTKGNAKAKPKAKPKATKGKAKKTKAKAATKKKKGAAAKSPKKKAKAAAGGKKARSKSPTKRAKPAKKGAV